MNMETTSNEASSIEEARARLTKSRIEDFVQTLENDEDPSDERSALIDLVSKSIARLLEVEQVFVKDMLEEGQENICLGCFSDCITDCANLSAVASTFNHYLKEGSEQG